MPEIPTPEEFTKPTNDYGLMSFKEYAEREHDIPYIFELAQGNKSLTYYGSDHSHDPENPMFADIEAKFISSNPDMVIVEGVSQLAEQIDKFKASLKEASREEIIKRFGEPGFALKLAIDHGKAVESPEPKFSDEINHLLQQGYGKEEIFAFYMYRSANQFQRTPDKASIQEYLKPDIEEFRAATNWKNFDYSIENLKTIGKRLWGNRGDLDNAEFAQERIDPTPWNEQEKQQTIVNQVAAESSKFRDLYMIKRLEELLKTKDRIFVVFGASHAYMQQPALAKLFEKL